MKEQEQLQAIHDRLIKYYDDMNTGLFVPSSTIEDIADIIEKNQILSPIPHQDGASAEDVVKATIMGYVDPNKVAKISGELMRVFQSEVEKAVAEKDMEIIDGEWSLIGHSYQIADTGDYDGYYEITNGKLSIRTNDDDAESLKPIVNALNRSGIKFWQDDAAEFENKLFRDEIKELQSELSAANERIKELEDAAIINEVFKTK